MKLTQKSINNSKKVTCTLFLVILTILVFNSAFHGIELAKALEKEDSSEDGLNPSVEFKAQLEPQSVEPFSYSKISEFDDHNLPYMDDMFVNDSIGVLFSTYSSYSEMGIVDLSDPNNMTLLSSIRHRYHLLDISVRGKLLFAAGEDYIDIYNLSDLSNPTKIVGVDYFSITEIGSIRKIAVAGDYLYLFQAFYSDENILVLNISDLLDISFVTGYSSAYIHYPEDILIDENTLYIADYSLGLSVFDISDPTNITYTSSFAFDSATKVLKAADQRILLMSYHDNGLCTLDVSDLTSITLLDTYNYGMSFYLTTAAISDNYLYLINQGDELTVLDLSNLSNLVVVNVVLLPVFMTSIYVDNLVAYCLTYSPKMVSLDFADLENISVITVLDLAESSFDVIVHNNVIISSESIALEFINITDLREPKQIAQLESTDYITKLAIKDNILFCLTSDELILVNITDISNPTVITSYRDTITGRYYADFQFQGNVLFIEDRIRGFVILDISNVLSIDKIYSLDLNYVNNLETDGMAVIDSWLYLSCGDWLQEEYKITVFDISNLSNPINTSTVEISGEVTALAAQGDSLFAKTNYGLHSYDISDPANPLLRTQIISGDYYNGNLLVNDSIAIIYKDSTDSLVILDISNGSDIQVIAEIEVGIYIRGFSLGEDVLVVACERYGIQIFAIDHDSDGLPDITELDTYGTDPYNADSDFDDLQDGFEVLTSGTDPLDNDTDDDLMADGYEVEYDLDPLDPSDASLDPDGDGLTNVEEAGYNTNPNEDDTDRDGLNDFEEINTFGTDPTNKDSDGDNLVDGYEINQSNTDPLDSDSDDDLMDDYFEVIYDLNPNNATDAFDDPDNDTLINLDEYTNGTRPDRFDTDFDDLSDGEEIKIYLTDPLDFDTDDDFLNDGSEVLTYFTDPLDYDTDNDTMGDGYEVTNGLDPLDAADAAFDPDEDGLTNIQEFGFGTDPQSNDTDNDNLNDYEEIYTYNTSPTDPDTDGDWLDDGAEIGYGTDPLKPDTDGDGYADGIEVLSGTDPLDPDDYPNKPTTTPIGFPSGSGYYVGIEFYLVAVFGCLSLGIAVLVKRKER